ncbi:MAG: PAS domain S-box protein, partial [Humidesulfovibrio sp.]|nr:PAS domain S-box protein [Humidesulfovibrio sp.]
MSQQAPIKSRRLLLDRHLAPVLTAVFAGVLISTLVAYFYTKHTVENLAQGQIAQAMSFLDHEVTDQVQAMTTQTWLMSQEEAFRLSMEDSYIGRSALVAARPKLVGYVSGGILDRAFLANRTGLQILATDQGEEHKLNVSERFYFRQAIRGIPTIATVAVSKVTGKPILATANPLRGQDGTVIGAVVGVVDTGSFTRSMLREARIGKSGDAYILSDTGIVLATPQWAPQGGYAPGQDAPGLLANIAGEGLHRFTRNGERRICLSRRNEVTGWLLVVEADEREVLAPAMRLATVTSAISFLTLALVALALGALRRVMASLRKSESDHRALTELSPVGIATFNTEGVLEYLNRRARVILGLAPGAPLPQSIILEDSDGAPLVGERSPVALVLTQHASVLGQLTWHSLPDGSRKALDLNATLLADQDREAHGVVATLEDITERIASMKLLHQSEERFSSLFRLSPDSIVLSELDTGVIVDVNESFTNIQGVAREDVVGKTIQEIRLYSDDTQRADIMARVGHEGRALNVEAKSHDKNGAEVILSLSSQSMDIGEKRYRMTVARDITERIRAEQELRENRRLLESILNTVPLSIFWKDKNCVFLGCNAAFARSLGMSGPREIIGKTDFDLPVPYEQSAAYHADDLHVMSTLSPKLHYMESMTLEGGEHGWLETSKLPLLDDAGQAVGLLGMFENVTERVDAVNRLKQSEERFSRLFRLSPEAIVLIDAATKKIVDANEAFSSLTGYNLGDLLGRDTLEIGLYADPAKREEFFLAQAREGHVENLEFEGRRKDGQGFICSLAAQAMEIGSKKYILVMLRNVTELKKMQEMMIQTEKMISVGGIAAGIAHEINNPLGIVLQAAQNLVQRTRPDFKKNMDVAAKLGFD